MDELLMIFESQFEEIFCGSIIKKSYKKNMNYILFNGYRNSKLGIGNPFL